MLNPKLIALISTLSAVTIACSTSNLADKNVANSTGYPGIENAMMVQSIESNCELSFEEAAQILSHHGVRNKQELQNVVNSMAVRNTAHLTKDKTIKMTFGACA